MYPPSVTPTVALFDVDGTLIDAGGAGRRSLEEAFRQVVGHDEGLAFSFAGGTDLAIIAEGLRRSAVDEADFESSRRAVAEAYLRRLPDEVNAARGYEVFPGVSWLLQAAVRVEGLAVGLGTGNLRDGATIKLDRGGLNHFFSFGGFGSDHEDRPEILRVGAERGAAELGLPLEACRVVVIGDTPRDVSAALAIDADCVGVGTGSSSPEELLSCGATCAFADLEAEGARQAILQRCQQQG
jgi:phosphoglycolate phosphatase